MRPGEQVKTTLPDRIVAWLDPVRGLQRQRARQVLALTGGYTGARRDRRQTQNLVVTDGDADAEVLPDLPMLRDRSRHLSRNAPLASGAIDTHVVHAVGTGLKVQPRIDREFLGLSDDEADAWERAALREWSMWAESTECDITRTQRFVELQDLALRSMLEAGDVFSLRRFVEHPGSPFGLKIQILEADMVSNPHRRQDGVRLENGHKVAGGVETDRNGAPVAYYITNEHPGRVVGRAALEWKRVGAFTPTGLRRVYHLFDRKRPNQSRGVPLLAPVLETFVQLDRYTEAEIMAAVISAALTVFVKTETGQGIGENAQDPTRTATQKASEIQLGSGSVFDLLPGESIETVDPQRPNTAFDPFVKAIMQQIGVGLGMPFEVLTMVFNSSFSASRAALLQAWKKFRTRRMWLASGFCQPWYENLLTESIARGRLQAPGFFEDPTVRRAWLGAVWTGPAPGQIDPESEVAAARERIDLGVSTKERETAELTGEDWEAVIRQRGKEIRAERAAGIEASPSGSALPARTRQSPAAIEREREVG